MSKQSDRWLLMLAVILVSRFIGMALFPFVDTTEPRYAEIARIMAESGDWITPWFGPGVPFWGKPPLSFWAQAAAINVFGLSEFALRLPSWLATLAVVWLTWRLARQLWGARVAQWSVVVFATMALTYISAGAVMTDAFLALGTTLTLVSFFLVMSGQAHPWRWLFFVGLVIGLLSKGPLAVVLAGIPVVLWLPFSGQGVASLKKLPWVGGIILTALLAGPWYVLAELKTPGFLDYFIIGEHLLRFLDPGWGGDLYGSAHDQPKGMVWVFWLWASFPWGTVALVGLGLAWFRGAFRATLHQTIKDPGLYFVLVSALAPMLFFTLAGNTLWTYVLPSLPFSAILIGRWVSAFRPRWPARMRTGLVALVPVLLTVFIGLSVTGWQPLKTERGLVSYYQQIRKTGDSPLIYLEEIPFSARFYSGGRAVQASEQELIDMQSRDVFQRLYVAVPLKWSEEKVDSLSLSVRKILENRRYQLLAIETSFQNQGVLSNVERFQLDGH